MSKVSLYCSKCGCFYGLRREGEVCGDRSGGVNTGANPCDGVLRMERYSLDLHNRQRASLGMPSVDKITWPWKERQ